MYEFEGTVKNVCELQKFASGFEKQDLVVEEAKDGKWPNVVAFSFKKEAIAKLSGITPGTRVKIGFAIDGREWTDPKTSKVRYFTDLTALRLDIDGSCTAAPAPADPLEGIPYGVDDEPPF